MPWPLTTDTPLTRRVAHMLEQKLLIGLFDYLLLSLGL